MAGVSIAEGEERGPPKQRTERKNKCGGVEAYGVFVARKGHVVLEGDESAGAVGLARGPQGWQIIGSVTGLKQTGIYSCFFFLPAV